MAQQAVMVLGFDKGRVSNRTINEARGLNGVVYFREAVRDH
jgi:hypothetical protein